MSFRKTECGERIPFSPQHRAVPRSSPWILPAVSPCFFHDLYLREKRERRNRSKTPFFIPLRFTSTRPFLRWFYPARSTVPKTGNSFCLFPHGCCPARVEFPYRGGRCLANGRLRRPVSFPSDPLRLAKAIHPGRRLSPKIRTERPGFYLNEVG